MEIKRTRNEFTKQINNLKTSNENQLEQIQKNAKSQINSLKDNIDLINDNAKKEINALSFANDILTTAKKFDKSSNAQMSSSDIITALMNLKLYAGSKAYKALKSEFTLQPETQERLTFLKEYFPDAFNEIEQAAEAASKSLLQANKEAADKASKLFLDAVNKGNKLLNKFYK